MIAYDGMGHLCCLIARTSGQAGDKFGLASLWNKYSTWIWPSFGDSVFYDAWWSAFFFGAIVLLIIGSDALRNP